jgi:hypothetical protein
VGLARSTSRAKAWKWSIAGGGVAAFLVIAQILHAGDASRPSTPTAAVDAATAATQAGGVTWICVQGPYGYSCAPEGGYGGTSTSGYARGASGRGSVGAFANTRSSGS